MIHIFFQASNIIVTVLFLVILIYWLVVLFGVLDFDTFDVDFDVEVDVGLGVFVGQKEHLSYDEIGRGVGHRAGHEDDPVLEQTREDVVGALASAFLLDHDWNQLGHGG